MDRSEASAAIKQRGEKFLRAEQQKKFCRLGAAQIRWRSRNGNRQLRRNFNEQLIAIKAANWLRRSEFRARRFHARFCIRSRAFEASRNSRRVDMRQCCELRVFAQPKSNTVPSLRHRIVGFTTCWLSRLSHHAPQSQPGRIFRETLETFTAAPPSKAVHKSPQQARPTRLWLQAR
jgi:hypothetical protein